MFVFGTPVAGSFALRPPYQPCCAVCDTTSNTFAYSPEVQKKLRPGALQGVEKSGSTTIYKSLRPFDCGGEMRVQRARHSGVASFNRSAHSLRYRTLWYSTLKGGPACI